MQDLYIKPDGPIIFKLRHIFLFCAALLPACNVADTPPAPGAITVDVTGDDFNWHFRYPGTDGVLGTDDDKHSVQNLYLPENTQVKLKLHSKDYLYSFALPDFDVKEIAVPDMDFELNFHTGSEASLPLLGDQFCGFSHKSLMGEVRIQNQRAGFYAELH